jgi:hypothetical protein
LGGAHGLPLIIRTPKKRVFGGFAHENPIFR